MYVVIDFHDLKDWDAPWRLDQIPAIGPHDTLEEAVDSATSRWCNRYDDPCQTVVHNNPHNDLPVLAKVIAEDPDDREICILPITKTKFPE